MVMIQIKITPIALIYYLSSLRSGEIRARKEKKDNKLKPKS